MSSCCQERKTIRPEEQKKKLMHRLSRLEGQIRGIRGMIENDAYCTDILTQSAAAAAAIHSFNRELLNSHIRGCVSEGIRSGDEQVVDDLMDTLYKLMK